MLRRRLEESEGGKEGYTAWCQLRKVGGAGFTKLFSKPCFHHLTRFTSFLQLGQEYATLLYGPGPRLVIFRPGVIRDWDQRYVGACD